MMLVVLLLALVSVALLLLMGINPLFMGIMVVFLMLSIGLALRGNVKFAGSLAPFAALVLFGALMFQNYGIRDMAILALPVLVIAASLLNGWRGAIFFGIVALLLLAALYISELNGWVNSPFTPYNSLSDYIAAAVAVGFIAALQWAVIQRMNKNISDTRRALAERIRAEDALRESEARYRLLVEGAPIPIMQFDAQLKILEVNPAFVSLMGYSSEEIIGSSMTALIEASDLAGQSFRFTELQAGETISGERLLVAKNGQHIPIYYTSRKLPDGRFQTVFQDISLRKKKENAIRVHQAELEERVRERTSELEASNRELESFSYAVSHDLRAPLRAISGFSEILSQNYNDVLDASGEENLNRIRENVRKMGLLIDDLLAFSRLGRGRLYSQRVYVRGLVEDVIVSFEADLASRRVVWNIGNLPDCLADYAMLRQVFANLIDNALKYSRSRSQAEINIWGSQEAGELVYCVADNGVGFDMQYAGKLFGVFNRLHHDEEVEGTGIGLAIVQRVVQRHGGRVWVEAEADQGARFYFSIPVIELEEN